MWWVSFKVSCSKYYDITSQGLSLTWGFRTTSTSAFYIRFDLLIGKTTLELVCNFGKTCMLFWYSCRAGYQKNGCSTKCSIFCSQMNDKYLWPGVYMHYLVQNCFPVVILMALYIYVPMCVCCVSVCVFPCRFLYTCLYSCSLIIHLFSPTTTTT